MSIIRVKAMVIDTKKLILYKEDGSTVSIPQGDPRLKPIVDQVMPIVNNGGVAEVDLLIENPYRDFEQSQTEGTLVRFFRTTKRRLGGIFKPSDDEASEEIAPGVFGEIPIAADLNTAIEEIIANAVPASSAEFSAADRQPDETMVAVIDNDDGSKSIVPGVESLEHIIAHSAKNRGTKGVQALIKRMAGYVHDRQHSVEDLLRFLEKGDLPIADDGSILAYKSLNSVHGEEGVFVDCHTGKVRQRVGSRVQVAEELVDKNRRNECSNGLHIGRRGYMQSFGGNVMVLCKIAPEDVIVVPHNDPNKVRVCAYHILARLPEEARYALRANKPMTEIKGLSELLGKALEGKHVDVLETVEIGGQMGSNVTITPTGAVRAKGAQRVAKPEAPATAIDDRRNAKPEPGPGHTIDPKAVVKEIAGSRQQKAQALVDIIYQSSDQAHKIKAAKDLVAFKKKVKISWDRLGVQQGNLEYILAKAAETLPAPAPVKKPASKKKAKPAPKLRKSDPVKVAEALNKPVQAPTSKPLSKGQELRQLHDSMLSLNEQGDTQGKALAAVQARKLLDTRRGLKKSWAALGLPDINDEDLKKIINAAPVDVPHVAAEPAAPPPATVASAPVTREPGSRLKKARIDRLAKQFTSTGEVNLSSERKAALALVRGGKTVSAASKETGVHRRTIDRDVTRFGK